MFSVDNSGVIRQIAQFLVKRALKSSWLERINLSGTELEFDPVPFRCVEEVYPQLSFICNFLYPKEPARRQDSKLCKDLCGSDKRNHLKEDCGCK